MFVGGKSRKKKNAWQEKGNKSSKYCHKCCCFRKNIVIIAARTEKVRAITTSALNNLWRYLQGLMLTQSEREWLVGKLSEPVKPEEEEVAVESLKRHKVIPLSPDVEYLSSLHLREFTQEVDEESVTS